MQTAEKQSFVYLDVLRFFSFLLIFLHHCNFLTYIPAIDKPLLRIYPRFHIGVQLFFCLSAFLLTHLAIQEYRKAGRFSQWRFLIRRGLRIYPLYYLFIALVFLFMPVAAHWAGFSQVTLPPLTPYLFFYNNFYTATGLFMLVFLWSIAVEEQFYIFYSFILNYLYRWLLPVALALIAGYIVFRSLNAWHSAPEGHHTLNFLPCFAGGIIAALLYNSKYAALCKQCLCGWQSWLLYGFALWLVFFAVPLYKQQWFNVYEQGFYSIVYSLIILQLAFLPARQHRVEKLLVFLGQRTYGLYVWHGFVLTLIYKEFPHIERPYYFTAVFFIAFAATLTLALLSYRFWEAPFLRLKRKFR